MDGVDAQGLGGGSFGKRLASDVRGDPADDLDQPGGSRVHDACLPQDLELTLSLCDGLVSSDDEGGQKPSRLSPFRASASSARARIAVSIVPSTGSRQPRTPYPTPSEGPWRRSRSRPPHRAQNVPGAADDLGQDHARVPARSEQRGPRDVGVAALERLDHRSGRKQHVRPGVAVGHRIDVQVVDSCAVGLESGLGGTREVEH